MIKRNTTKLLTTFFVLSVTTSCVCWQVKPQVAYLTSIQFNKCQARCLDIKTLNTLPPSKCGEDWATDVIDLPLEACDDVIGFKLKTVAEEIRPQALESIECAEDHGCN